MTELRIPGVPATIDRAKFGAMLAELGLPAKDVREFSASRDGIKASVLARNEAGKHFADGDEIATHEVFIRLVDDD